MPTLKMLPSKPTPPKEVIPYSLEPERTKLPWGLSPLAVPPLPVNETRFS